MSIPEEKSVNLSVERCVSACRPRPVLEAVGDIEVVGEIKATRGPEENLSCPQKLRK